MSVQLKRWELGLMLEFLNLQRLCAANVPFCWNRDLQNELDAMKKAIKVYVKLSPLTSTRTW